MNIIDTPVQTEAIAPLRLFTLYCVGSQLRTALTISAGDKIKAAHLLKISLATLYRKLDATERVMQLQNRIQIPHMESEVHYGCNIADSAITEAIFTCSFIRFRCGNPHCEKKVDISAIFLTTTGEVKADCHGKHLHGDSSTYVSWSGRIYCSKQCHFETRVEDAQQ